MIWEVCVILIIRGSLHLETGQKMAELLTNPKSEIHSTVAYQLVIAIKDVPKINHAKCAIPISKNKKTIINNLFFAYEMIMSNIIFYLWTISQIHSRFYI